MWVTAELAWRIESSLIDLSRKLCSGRCVFIECGALSIKPDRSG